MYSHFVSYLGFCSTEEDKIHNGATLHVAFPILSMPADALVTKDLKDKHLNMMSAKWLLYFVGNVFKCIFLNENVQILMQI